MSTRTRPGVTGSSADQFASGIAGGTLIVSNMRFSRNLSSLSKTRNESGGYENCGFHG